MIKQIRSGAIDRLSAQDFIDLIEVTVVTSEQASDICECIESMVEFLVNPYTPGPSSNYSGTESLVHMTIQNEIQKHGVTAICNLIANVININISNIVVQFNYIGPNYRQLCINGVVSNVYVFFYNNRLNITKGIKEQ